jgi:nucleotide-binding universal stress UspA family protein
MTGPPEVMAPIARVLAVVEGADAAGRSAGGDDEVLPAAQALAARHGAALAVLACLPRPSDLGALARATGAAPDAVLARLAEEHRRAVAAQAASALPGAPPPVHVALGNPFIEVIGHVLRHGADIVVKTARPLSGLHGVFFASTDQHLVRKCPCPVWLRVPQADPRPRNVIAAVDVDLWDAREPETLTALNRRVIETALRLGAEDGPVQVLHALEAVGEGLLRSFAAGDEARAAAAAYVRDVEGERRRALSALIAGFRGREGAGRLRAQLVRGPARSAIAEAARRLSADLVVMGTVARTGLGGVIIGNTAEDILNSVDCSVVAVKPEGFVSPIAAHIAPDTG